MADEMKSWIDREGGEVRTSQDPPVRSWRGLRRTRTQSQEYASVLAIFAEPEDRRRIFGLARYERGVTRTIKRQGVQATSRPLVPTGTKSTKGYGPGGHGARRKVPHDEGPLTTRSLSSLFLLLIVFRIPRENVNEVFVTQRP